MENSLLEDETEKIITYFSAGNTGFTEFQITPDGEGAYYHIEAGKEQSYIFEMDEEQVEDYRDRLWENITKGSAFKNEYNTGSTDIVVYQDDEHRSGRLTREGKKIVNEMLSAFEENKK